MSKYRVYELAKEFKTESKVVLNILARNNYTVKNHMSNVGEEEKALIAKVFSGKTDKPKESPRPVPEAKQEMKARSGAKGKPESLPKAEGKARTEPQAKAETRTAQARAKSAMQPQPEQRPGQPPKMRADARPQTEARDAAPRRRPDQGAEPRARQEAGGDQRNRPERNTRQKNEGGRPGQRPAGQPRERSAQNGGGRPEQRRQQPSDRPQAQQARRHEDSRRGGNGGGNRNHGNPGGGNSGNNRNRPGGGQTGRNAAGRPRPAENNNSNNNQRRGGNDNSGGRNKKHAGNAQGNRQNNNARNNRRPDNNQGGNRGNRFGKNRNKRNDRAQQVQKVEIARPKHIKLGETIAVKDLASKMSYTAAEIMKKLMFMGVMATINQEIDFDTAALVAAEFGVTAEALPPETDPTEIPEIEDDPSTLVIRPPVVTVMGHVDHGKTSLLDAIRKTSVSAHEAGGITQHIGAYQVICQGKKIVFLDTPGHEAFTAMRARGAQVTDIAILVVAADDGVMPQTVEAINHAKSAGVPIIVAINKIDKPGANPDRVKQELAEHELIPEEWGGETIMVPVSAKQKIGLNELLEMVLLVAEVKELKANPNRDARGVIIEAQLDKGRGTVATVLVQNGTLRIGDTIIAGTTYGKVRAMINDRGENVRKAGPSVPVEVLGLNGVPEAGDQLAVLEEKLARSIAEKRIEKQRTELIRSKKVSLDDLFQQIQEGNIKDLNIVVKADVQGSVEALNSSLLSLNKNDEVRVNVVHSGVGAVNESDVMLASASNALIIAFNVRPDANARRIADAENIDIRTYRVIYDALNDVKAAMSGLLAPKYKEVVQGRVEIRKVMKFSKALVAGSYVLEGKIMNNSKIRIIRDNIELFDGEIDSLRRFKDDVKEVSAGYECGISLVDYRDFREGDIIEAYTMEEIKTSITEANEKAEEKKAEDGHEPGGAAKS